MCKPWASLRLVERCSTLSLAPLCAFDPHAMLLVCSSFHLSRDSKPDSAVSGFCVRLHFWTMNVNVHFCQPGFLPLTKWVTPSRKCLYLSSRNLKGPWCEKTVVCHVQFPTHLHLQNFHLPFQQDHFSPICSFLFHAW